MEIKNKLRKNMKNSIIVGGLIGTAGLFVAKLLGLLYSIPLSSLLGSDELMSYYGTAYQLYSYVLNVFTAGIPFAISTVVAKYTLLGDNKSLMTIKKISMTLLGAMGLVGMLLLVILSGKIGDIVAAGGNPSVMAMTMRILALAVFFVPILSGFRGFWQGRKEMGEYALSQTFEQIFRVAFLLSTAYLIVYVFGMERRFALYSAVLSTSVAAVAGILQIMVFDHKNIKEIKEGAASQEGDGIASSVLLKELILLAVPYLMTAVIGYCDEVFNSMLLPIGLQKHGYTAAENSIIIAAFNYVGYKLTSIPQILAPAFAAALIPHITEAVTNEDNHRVARIVSECVGIVIFIGSMASFCIAIYASDIYNVLYYTSNVELSSSVVRWLSIEGFLGTICPVTSSLMIALGFKKAVLTRQMISAVLKGIVMVPLIMVFGFKGAILSSVVGNVYIFLGNLRQIDSRYNIDLNLLMKDLLKILVALAGMFAVSFLMRKAGFDSAGHRRIAGLGLICVNGMAALLAYFTASHFLTIPQDLFHKDFVSVIKAKLHR